MKTLKILKHYSVKGEGKLISSQKVREVIRRTDEKINNVRVMRIKNNQFLRTSIASQRRRKSISPEAKDECGETVMYSLEKKIERKAFVIIISIIY